LKKELDNGRSSWLVHIAAGDGGREGGRNCKRSNYVVIYETIEFERRDESWIGLKRKRGTERGRDAL